MNIMSWILLSVLAALLWAVSNVLDKFLLSKYIKEPMVPLLSFGFVGIISSLIVFFFNGFGQVSFHFLVVAFFLGLMYVLANILYFLALQGEEVSRVISLLYLDPLFTAVMSAVFLGEVFSVSKYFGILLLVLGAILISYRKASGFKISKGIIYCIISAFLFAVYNLVLKYMLGQTNFWIAFAYIRFFTFIGLLPIYYFYFKPFVGFIKQTKVAAISFTSNAISLIAILFFTIATSIGYVTLTTSLSAVQPFFILFITLILSLFYPHLLKEEHAKGVFWQKLFAIILMFVGVLLIS